MADAVYLARHASADYPELDRYGQVYRGARYDFVPLSSAGVGEARDLALALCAIRPGLIVSSPYTRTLQTAHVLAKFTDTPLTVDLGLHDWLAVCDGHGHIDDATVAAKIAEYDVCHTAGTLPTVRTWETDTEMRLRLRDVADRHAGHGILVLVTHALPIQAATGAAHVAPASLHRWDLPSDPSPLTHA